MFGGHRESHVSAGESAPMPRSRKKKKHRTEMYLELAKGMQENMTEEDRLGSLHAGAQVMRSTTQGRGEPPRSAAEQAGELSLGGGTGSESAPSSPYSPLPPGTRASTRIPRPSTSPGRPVSVMAKSMEPSSRGDNPGMSRYSLFAGARMEQRALSLEHRPGHEIFNRIRSWGLVENRSYDANASRFDSSPLRAIDIGKWAEGSSFKLAKKDGWYDAEYAIITRNFFRGHFGWQLVSMIAILIALFLADTFVILQVPGNIEQDAIMTIVCLIFLCEFVGLSMADQEYPRSYFFWVDLVGLLSLSFDISYLFGQDAMAPEVFHTRDSTVAHHATRLARQSVRAGRVCRVLKIARFVSDNFMSDDSKDDNMAHMISDQITDAITTRVAFLTASLALILPVFFMASWPEVDESIATWTDLLSRDFGNYVEAVHSNVTGRIPAARSLLLEDFHLLRKFYEGATYGPYKVCHRDDIHDRFICHTEVSDIDVSFEFKEPYRRASIWLYSQGRIRCFFNREVSKQSEATVYIFYLFFIVLLMVLFGFLLKHTVSSIALQPLERMLAVVRERSQEIFKFATDLQPGQTNTDERGRESVFDPRSPQQVGEENEFILLEKAFSKFYALTNLATANKEEDDDREDMDQNDVMLRNLRGLRSNNENDRELLIKYRTSRVSTATGRYDPDEDDEESEHDRLSWFHFKLPAHILDGMQEWDFDTFELAKPNTSLFASYILFSTAGCRDWVKHNVPQNTILKFIPLVESHYLANPFHNFGHATDVCFSISHYFNYFQSDAILGELTMFWLLVAGIGHDIGHVGVNNGFLVETSHPFALTYNDRSPLENMHCAALFQLLALPEANVFSAMEQAIVKEARKGMIVAILHTDIVQHGRLVRDFGLLYQMNTKTIDQQDSAFIELLMSNPSHQLIINLFLHCCDVGNPMKPWPLCSKIANMVMEEYFNQGDKEKEAEIPVQMLNDRNKVNKPNSQIGFIEFLIAPMVETVVKVFPGMDFLSDNLAKNLGTWLRVWIEESTPPEEEVVKTKNRVEKVLATLNTSCGVTLSE